MEAPPESEQARARRRHLELVQPVAKIAFAAVKPFHNLDVHQPLKPEQGEATPPEAPVDHLYD